MCTEFWVLLLQFLMTNMDLRNAKVAFLSCSEPLF